MVYVQSIDGTPLMPCSDAKARRLLKQRRARRVRNTPFTIRLRFVVDGHTQPVSLGVDPGYQHVGLSATANGKVLFEAVAECRTDIPTLMETRRRLRRSRRNRKTRYRKPRFNNRVHSKYKGWLAPSVEQRIAYHMRLVDYVCGLLPVSRIVVEVAKFDIQKLKDELIKGVEYQHGEQYGFDMSRITSGSVTDSSAATATARADPTSGWKYTTSYGAVTVAPTARTTW